MSIASTPAVLGRRACAVLAAFSAGLHGLMVGQATNLAAGAVVLAMMVACLYCARDLWLGSSVRAWCLVALMNLGMIAVHWSVPDCHGGAPVTVSAAPSALMMTATSVAAAEAAIATAVLFILSRDRASRLALP